MFQRTKLSLGNYYLGKKISHLNIKRETVNFEDAKKIGLLFDASEEAGFELVKQYVKEMRLRHKEVSALGFVDKKEIAPNQFSQLGLEFFTKKNLDWRLIPKHASATNFINEKFDVVINLAANEIFPLRYIAAVSNTPFRVGRFDDEFTFCYDLMIQMKSETDQKEFIEEVEKYLRQIKK